ncbi:MAG: 8-amino-7-oxononanoate synthase [Chromatiales bacterium]|nr:8-amino-7-oxononanoate synthase [Chromatiales bacterium]
MFELAAALDQRRADGAWRERHALAAMHGPAVERDGRRLVNFCGNDYLGLAADRAVVAALIAAARRYGVGSGAAQLVTGYSDEHAVLERELAAFTGREAALLFPSGWMANQGAIGALLGRGDAVFCDRLNHASLIDAARASGARFVRYRHCDPDDLAARLAATPARRRLIVTDAVFSMDGDRAPLAALAALSRQHDAWLMVDDAHGFGVLGAGGAGSLEAAGLGQRDVPVLMATLGKAVGVAGAFVAGSRELTDTLTQFARSFIYTTAPPPALAAAARAAITAIRTRPELRAGLAGNVARFRARAAAAGIELSPSQTPIQPILLGSNERALEASRELAEAGFLVTAIRPPTVPAGSARLRVTLSTAHTHGQIDAFVAALGEVLAALPT